MEDNTAECVECPTCRMTVPLGAAKHQSVEGPVRYLRCVCGRWLVHVGTELVASAGRSDFAAGVVRT